MRAGWNNARWLDGKANRLDLIALLKKARDWVSANGGDPTGVEHAPLHLKQPGPLFRREPRAVFYAAEPAIAVAGYGEGVKPRLGDQCTNAQQMPAPP